MIVQVLLPQAQTEHTLLQHDLKIMLNERRMATIFEASGGTLQGCRHTVNFTQQQRPAIPRHVAAIKIGHNTLATMGLEIERILRSNCIHGMGSLSVYK